MPALRATTQLELEPSHEAVQAGAFRATLAGMCEMPRLARLDLKDHSHVEWPPPGLGRLRLLTHVTVAEDVSGVFWLERCLDSLSTLTGLRELTVVKHTGESVRVPVLPSLAAFTLVGRSQGLEAASVRRCTGLTQLRLDYVRDCSKQTTKVHSVVRGLERLVDFEIGSHVLGTRKLQALLRELEPCSLRRLAVNVTAYHRPEAGVDAGARLARVLARSTALTCLEMQG